MTEQSKSKLYLQYLFILFLTFLIFPSSFYQIPKTGLDPSWNISLHLANKYDLVFGKDFVFTYGPFGVLYSRLPISVNKYFYLLFDLYFLCTFIFVARKIFKAYFNFIIVLFAFLIVIVAMYDAAEQWFFFFLLFFLFSFLKEPAGKIGYLVQAALISIFCFYYKLGLGISSLTIFTMAITYAVIRKKLPVRNYIIIVVSYLLILWLCAVAFNVDMKGYLKGAIHIIDGFNDSMFIPLAAGLYKFAFASIAILAIIAFWILYRLITFVRKKEVLRNIDEIFLYLLFTMAVYVLFKSSFVRFDGHIFLFFKSMSIVIILIYLFTQGKIEKRIASFACWAVVLISLWVVNSAPGSYKPVNRIFNLSFIDFKIGEIKNYFTGLKNYDAEVTKSDKLLSQDNEFRKIIGNHSVDIIPAEVSKIYFNGFHYNPRPVIQSYTAYDGYLDNLNYEKYMSANAPDYVLFSMSSIDDRFAFFDETKTKLALINNYKVVGEVDEELILKKRDTSRSLIKLKEEENLIIKLGEDILVKRSSDIQVSSLFIEYNLTGKLRRLVYQPPVMKIFFTLENDEIKSFRVSKTILEGGVILNKFVDNKEEFQLLMQSDGKLSTSVKKIRLESYPANTGFIRTVRMKNSYYRFANKPTSEQITDSIGITGIMNKFRPLRIGDTTVLQPEELHYNIEDFSSHGQTIRVSGWAFSEKNDNKNFLVKAILQSGNTVYELPSERKHRPDLPAFFARDDIEYSGISSLVSRAQLPPGEYKLGIGLFSTDNKLAKINYTDRHINIDAPNSIQKINRIEPRSFTDQVSYNIELVAEEQDRFLIQGWSFLKNGTTKKDTTNLILQNERETFRVGVASTKRVDIAAVFKNPLLENSGFSVYIPKDKFPEGEYMIGIEKIHGNDKRHNYVLTNKIVRIGDGSFNTSPIGKLPAVQKFNAVIDHLDEGSDFFTVAGWAVENISNVQNSKIEIILKGSTSSYVAATEIRSRPDVTAYLKSTINIDRCGFSAKISKKDLEPGRYEIGICIKQKEGDGVVKFQGRFISKK
ncbi:MAG TPA: hypothetical protein VK492_10450 [Chitinophagaceae bacterium]|nr:hypothetical protein [Chitinophagaceae bacterium]